MTVQPQLFADHYTVTAVVPREGAKPLVVRSVLCGFGWSTCYRDTKAKLRWTIVGSKAAAVDEVARIALARPSRAAVTS
jgi:hypothetical protein